MVLYGMVKIILKMILYNQEKLINETENEFNIQYTLIKDKLKKRE